MLFIYVCIFPLVPKTMQISQDTGIVNKVACLFWTTLHMNYIQYIAYKCIASVLIAIYCLLCASKLVFEGFWANFYAYANIDWLEA